MEPPSVLTGAGSQSPTSDDGATSPLTGGAVQSSATPVARAASVAGPATAASPTPDQFDVSASPVQPDDSVLEIPHIPAPDATDQAPVVPDIAAIEAIIAAANDQSTAEEKAIIASQIAQADATIAADAPQADLQLPSAPIPPPQALPNVPPLQTVAMGPTDNPQNQAMPTPTESAMKPIAAQLPVQAPPAQLPPLPPPPAQFTADQYAAKYAAASSSKKRVLTGMAILGMAAVLFLGLATIAALYVRKTNSTVLYQNYQQVTSEDDVGSGGYRLDIPVEYQPAVKSGNNIEYSHKIPQSKGSGDYGGIAISSSQITDAAQREQITKLREQLKAKDSNASQQFLQLVSGNTVANQQVVPGEYIEKTGKDNQAFFGYEIQLQKEGTSVGKGWMVFTVTDTHMYVLVMYATTQVWNDNQPAWDHILTSFDS